MMADELERNGVTICTNAKVDKIIVEKGKVRGVEAYGKSIASKAVVSNSGITNTIYNLTERNAFSEEFLEKAATVRINNSSCQVYMGIKAGEEINDVGDLLFTSTAAEFDSTELLDKETKSKTFS